MLFCQHICMGLKDLYVWQCVKTDSPTSLLRLSRSDVLTAVTNKVQIHTLLSSSYFIYIWNFLVMCTKPVITYSGFIVHVSHHFHRYGVTSYGH